jgi:hypothetical protein
MALALLIAGVAVTGLGVVAMLVLIARGKAKSRETWFRYQPFLSLVFAVGLLLVTGYEMYTGGPYVLMLIGALAIGISGVWLIVQNRREKRAE